MRSNPLPSAEEVSLLIPDRGSAVYRYADDTRVLAGAGYALLLQVSHPTIGAGVAQYSDFKAEPWGRLFRTLDFTYSLTYGGPKMAADVGARIFEMHKQISGVRPDGERYHALEPRAYAWVHATLAEAVISGHRHFGRKMRPDEIEDFWAEWRQMGRILGVHLDQLPEDWAGFREYFDTMVEEELGDNETVQDVIEATSRPPAFPHVNDALWRVGRVPLTRLLALGTFGMLPPLLRQRFGVRWARAKDLEFRALARASRATTPLLPHSLRHSSQLYLRWRREALARGDVASRPPQRRAVAGAA